MRILLLFTLILFVPLLAQAQVGDKATGTRIDLAASAQALIANDEVVIAFRVERQGKNADAVRQYVNKVSTAIVQRLHAEKDVQLKTLSRSMHPVWQYPKNSQRVRVGWQMIQSGKITSTRLKGVPQWLDAIESAGANLSSLSFRISDAVSQNMRESLRQQAISNFRSKAAGMAKGLDAHSFRIIRLNTGSQMPQPRVYRSEMAMMTRSAGVAPPALSAGDNKISVTVSGEIAVPFTDFPVQ